MSDLDDIFANLSTDPHLGSYELLQRVGNVLLAKDPGEADYSAACGVLEAYYDANGWKYPSAVNPGGYVSEVDPAIERSRSSSRLHYEGFRHQIMNNYKAVMKKRAVAAIAGSAGNTFGYAILSSEEKREIHTHLEKARSIIEGSGLADGKKNALFDRLADLVLEVNRNGSRTDRFFAFASEFAFCARDFTQNAKPMFDEVKDILKIVTRARARHDGLKLPPSGELLSLPEPNNE